MSKNTTPIVYTTNAFNLMHLLARCVWILVAAPTERPSSETSWSRLFSRTVGRRLSMLLRQIISPDMGKKASSVFSPVEDSTTTARHCIFFITFLCFVFLLDSFRRRRLSPLFFRVSARRSVWKNCEEVDGERKWCLLLLLLSSSSSSSSRQASKTLLTWRMRVWFYNECPVYPFVGVGGGIPIYAIWVWVCAAVKDIVSSSLVWDRV